MAHHVLIHGLDTDVMIDWLFFSGWLSSVFRSDRIEG